MADKEQIIIDGEKEDCKILFRCKHIDYLAAYDMIRNGIKITPENAPIGDFELMLIENTDSPFGFSSVCKRNNKEDVWEHSGFGHSGACSIVTALLKRLDRKTQECEKLSILAQEESARNAYIEYELNDKLKQKTQECEQLKEDCTELERECERLKSYGATLLADKNAMEIGRDDYMQRCKQLEQECDKLEKENKVLRKLVSELEYSVQVGIELNDRYCKALEEIEEYCSQNKHAGWVDIEGILDIISKAKGEGNE